MKPMGERGRIESASGEQAGELRQGVMAVVVTYGPDPEQLCATLESLLPQVEGVALIDNTPGGLPTAAAEAVDRLRAPYPGAFFLVENRDNLGIAAAQNTGIELARRHGFEYVFLSDQDTVFAGHTVSTLCQGYRALTARGRRVGAVAAGYVNHVASAKACPVFVQHEGYRVRRVRAVNGLVPATYVIASGCLIPVDVFEQVGLKNESLFIDWVDTEWCLRARKAGFGIYGCADAVVAHRLGDSAARVFGRTISLHRPIRHYYMVRNALRLALYSDALNAGQRLWALTRALLFAACFPLLTRPRLEHLKMVSTGLVHGVLNKKGRFDV